MPPQQSIHTQIDTLVNTKSLNTTEDTHFVYTDDRYLTMMVADGASQRLKTTGSLKPLLEKYGENTTPARYAASLTRDVTAKLTIATPQTPVRDIALSANQRLREELESVYGELTAKNISQKEPSLTKLLEDPRYVRLILPICCITIARLDFLKGTLEYAHGGDTALFLLHQDGHTVQITPDQMGQHDDKVRLERRRVMGEHQPKDLAKLSALPSYAQAQEININNGIFHNYVDQDGNIDKSVGVGVINGLPQFEDYLVSGTMQTDDVNGIVLTSDGMFWPAPLGETEQASEKRINQMGDLIRDRGLDGYLQALHIEELADSDGKRYQHFGKLDDATAIYMKFVANSVRSR